MMAGDLVNAFVQQGTLYIYGTQQNDNIAVHVSDTKVEIPGVMIKNAQAQLVTSLSRDEVPYQVISTGQAGDDVVMCGSVVAFLTPEVAQDTDVLCEERAGVVRVLEDVDREDRVEGLGLEQVDAAAEELDVGEF